MAHAETLSSQPASVNHMPDSSSLKSAGWTSLLRWLIALSFLAACRSSEIPMPTITPSPTSISTSTPSTVPPTPTTTPTATKKPLSTVNVAIYPGEILQTLRDVGGGNFIHWISRSSLPFDPVAKLNVETLHPGFVRVDLDLANWEPDNDDDDPYTQNAVN